MNQDLIRVSLNIFAGLKRSRLEIFPLLAITAEAYWYVLESAGILDELKDAMVDLDKTNLADLMKRGKVARDLILGAGIPVFPLTAKIS
jgi:phosphoenolpyruvate synthase/pyruvate phosphate dikinase